MQGTVSTSWFGPKTNDDDYFLDDPFLADAFLLRSSNLLKNACTKKETVKMAIRIRAVGMAGMTQNDVGTSIGFDPVVLSTSFA